MRLAVLTLFTCLSQVAAGDALLGGVGAQVQTVALFGRRLPDSCLRTASPTACAPPASGAWGLRLQVEASALPGASMTGRLAHGAASAGGAAAAALAMPGVGPLQVMTSALVNVTNATGAAAWTVCAPVVSLGQLQPAPLRAGGATAFQGAAALGGMDLRNVSLRIAWLGMDPCPRGLQVGPSSSSSSSDAGSGASLGAALPCGSPVSDTWANSTYVLLSLTALGPSPGGVSSVPGRTPWLMATLNSSSAGVAAGGGWPQPGSTTDQAVTDLGADASLWSGGCNASALPPWAANLTQLVPAGQTASQLAGCLCPALAVSVLGVVELEEGAAAAAGVYGCGAPAPPGWRVLLGGNVSGQPWTAGQRRALSPSRGWAVAAGPSGHPAPCDWRTNASLGLPLSALEALPGVRVSSEGVGGRLVSWTLYSLELSTDTPVGGDTVVRVLAHPGALHLGAAGAVSVSLSPAFDLASVALGAVSAMLGAPGAQGVFNLTVHALLYVAQSNATGYPTVALGSPPAPPYWANLPASLQLAPLAWTGTPTLVTSLLPGAQAPEAVTAGNPAPAYSVFSATMVFEGLAPEGAMVQGAYLLIPYSLQLTPSGTVITDPAAPPTVAATLSFTVAPTSQASVDLPLVGSLLRVPESAAGAPLLTDVALAAEQNPAPEGSSFAWSQGLAFAVGLARAADAASWDLNPLLLALAAGSSPLAPGWSGVNASQPLPLDWCTAQSPLLMYASLGGAPASLATAPAAVALAAAPPLSPATAQGDLYTGPARAWAWGATGGVVVPLRNRLALNGLQGGFALSMCALVQAVPVAPALVDGAWPTYRTAAAAGAATLGAAAPLRLNASDGLARWLPADASPLCYPGSALGLGDPVCLAAAAASGRRRRASARMLLLSAASSEALAAITPRALLGPPPPPPPAPPPPGPPAAPASQPPPGGLSAGVTAALVVVPTVTVVGGAVTWAVVSKGGGSFFFAAGRRRFSSSSASNAKTGRRHMGRIGHLSL